LKHGWYLVVDTPCHLSIGAADKIIRAATPEPPDIIPFSLPASNAVMGKLFVKIGPTLNGVDERLKDMDVLGVDVQAISPSPRRAAIRHAHVL
jgi:aminocarboxymuconate-semialdehyde decarboxylase